ncbi:hypothetical protein [Streptomyces sp. PU-14G]|uniref:hypothetical protein n=1 Tax=Streptomyces sp. PU-14G TaxID=2800808 RepID=UPI0034DFAE06
MVNSPHEAHHRSFQEFPELFSRAFGLLGLPDPGPSSVDVLNCDVTEVKPLERRVDTLLRLACADGHTYLLVVESQTKKDPGKARSWGYYLSYLANKYPKDHPVLLVLCRDHQTARWAAGPFQVGHRARANLHVTPFVLGPNNVPVITDVERAAADLPLAVFSALTHSNDRRIDDILDVLATALKKAPEDDRTALCAELTAIGLADSPSADLWRTLMGTGLFESRSWLAEGFRDQGRVQTHVEKLLQVLDTRHIPLTETQRERIVSCKDSELLNRWFVRAVTAGCAEEVFEAAGGEGTSGG